MSSLYDTALYDTATYDGVSVGNPLVELLLNSVWVNITQYVRVANGITITRGVQDWQAQPQAATCRLTLDNADGRFTMRYAAGAYYPYLTRNVQLRVSVRLDDGSNTVRFWGQVPTWPLTFDLTARDVQVQIEAAGIRRRLTVGAVPLDSPYTTFMTRQPTVLAYWPMEDEGGTTFASGLAGGAPALQAGATYASDASFAASLPLPSFTAVTSSFRGVVPSHTPSVAGEQVRWLSRTAGSSNGTWIVQVDTSGSHYFWLSMVPALRTAQLLMFNYVTGALEGTGGGAAWGSAFTVGTRWSIDFLQSGADIHTTVNYLVPGATAGAFQADVFAAATLGRVTGVRLFSTTQLPDGTPLAGSAAGTPDAMTFGQLSMENTISSSFDAGASLTAYAGETAAQRWARFGASPYNLPVDVYDGGNSAVLGPQGELTPLQILDEAAYVDGGLSTEDVTLFSLAYVSRTWLYSTSTPTEVFNIARANMVTPIDDDQALVNDMTVARTNGSSARVVATTGLTPAAVGTYAAQVTLNLYDDTALADQAGWRMNLGSVDKPRWQIGWDMLKLSAASGDATRAVMAGMREGDTIQVNSISAALGGTSQDQMHVLGWQETITQTSWDFLLNAAPGEPWNKVFVLDSATRGVLDSNRLGF